jgi:hypothetical protein
MDRGINAATPLNETVATPDDLQVVAVQKLLATMEVREPAFRRAKGSVLVLLPIPAQIFLYGPFLRLAQGRYVLTFRCRAWAALQGKHPVMGLEVIAQNRVLCVWRDYAAADLQSGQQSVTFDVPSELGVESGADAPFEFRFSHFGNAVLEMEEVNLRPTSLSDALAAPASSTDMLINRWRLLGRLKTLPLPGGVLLTPFSVSRLKFGRMSARLRLPVGPFRLDLACDLKHARKLSAPALEILVRTRDHLQLGSETFSAEQLASGHASFDFAVPMDASLDVGTPSDIEFRVRHFRNAWFALSALDLRRLAPDEVARPSARPPKAHSTVRLASKKVVIFGNCQAGLIAEALNSNAGFARQFSVKHHFMELAPNLHDQGKRDLETCELLLVQDIREWEQYPLRDHVPDNLTTLRYPCVRFASLWPFDAFNGPDDKLARNRDLPNFEFTYFDGLLARLRREIPDHEERFSAYRSLDIKGLIDVKRLHAFEEKRLQAMDQRFPGEIGAFILENFRKRQIFYTTGHPNGKLLKMLMQQIAKELGVRQPFWFPGQLDSLRRLQVPVHPKIASALDVSWVKVERKYLVRGEWLTWEDYIRKYIAYYG